MELESVFQDSKWRIITELCGSPMSPKELAEKTGSSLSNVSMQLNLLQALDFIQVKKLTNISRDMPRKIYSLKKEFVYLVLASKNVIGKKLIMLDQDKQPFFTVWLLNDHTSTLLLLKLFCDTDILVSDSIGFLNLKGDELEILVINANPESLGYLKDRTITRADKTYKIVPHIFSKENFQQGLGDPHFQMFLRKVIIISDKDNFLMRLKTGKAA